jgi:hypothetical protein
MASRPKTRDVIPAKAGIQGLPTWIPASAGMTTHSRAQGIPNPLDSALNTVLLGVALTVALVGLLRMIA